MQHDNVCEHNVRTFRPLKHTENEDDYSPVTWLSLPHKSRLLVLALCRLSEPLSNTCLLPYLYQLVRPLQPPLQDNPSSISRQAGFLVALFSLSQFFTSVPWAHFADHCGRKPAIIIGLGLSIISNVGFGFSKSISAVISWRVVAGIANGNIGVMRTMTAEIVKEKKFQSRAFLLLPLVFNSGNVIGLAVGGFLSDPTVNLPWLFGTQGFFNISQSPEGIAWLKAFPFALPTVWNAVVLSWGFILAVAALKETLEEVPEEENRSSWLDHLRFKWSRRRFAYIRLVDQDEPEARKNCANLVLPAMTTQRKKHRPSIFSFEIITRRVAWTLVSVFLFHLHNSAFIQTFPVYLTSPPTEHQRAERPNFQLLSNGLDLPSSKIGILLSSTAVFGILIQLLLYPTLQARFGTLTIYQFAQRMFPFVYPTVPLLGLISETQKTWQSAGIALVLLPHVAARTFAIPSSVILLTNSSPNPSALGRIHGVANMLSSLGRAIGPSLAGIVYGWSADADNRVLLFWLSMMLVPMLGAFLSSIHLVEEEE